MKLPTKMYTTHTSKISADSRIGKCGRRKIKIFFTYLEKIISRQQHFNLDKWLWNLVKLDTQIIINTKGIMLVQNWIFSVSIVLSSLISDDLDWWKQNINKIFMPTKNLRFVLEIFSDASMTGWDTCCDTNGAHGFWDKNGCHNPINLLELQAAFFSLKCFASNLNNSDIYTFAYW